MPKFEKGNQAKKGKFMLEGQVAERRLTRTKLEEILQKHLHKSKQELMDVLKDPATIALELMVVSVLVKAINTGDQVRLQFLLDRIIGKIPEKIEMKTQDVTDEEKLKKMALDILEVAKKPW